MPGSYAPNPHGGSRSEILADYLFSQWGTVNPVRWQDDYGVDLHCTLSETIGLRAFVRAYYTVQVKSNLDPWDFKDRESVQWLVEHPTPLFLAAVDKENGIVRVYHVTSRFYVQALGKLPSQLKLTPEDAIEGKFVEWTGGTAYSLSAPIIQVKLTDFIKPGKMLAIRKVFEQWVDFDRENCELVRFGLPRFRMPAKYRVNQVPTAGVGELGITPESAEFLERGIRWLAEGAECIGGELYRLDDPIGALQAALLVRHLQKRYSANLKKILRWRGDTMPGNLGLMVIPRLTAFALQMGFKPQYAYLGLDTVMEAIRNHRLVKAFTGENGGVKENKNS